MTRLLSLIKSHFVNDIEKSDKDIIVKKIHENAIFSFSFLALLISSSLICTLGLLLNSAPVVIGGMIISPLMWPLLKTALGISYEHPSYIKQAIILLILAIAVTFFSSTLITFISPIKNITTQILARTTPTLLDLVIALVAGTIAALAITQKKISESLAGVAIATSLMPPLCVSGIGLALMDRQTFMGGFLLFFTNAIAIIFVAVLVFYFIGIQRKTHNAIRRKGAYILISIIIITGIPLYSYLKTYSFKVSAYQKTKEILESSFKEISSTIVVANITTDITNPDRDILSVEAQILLPEDVSIDYNEQQKIINNLENKLHKKVNLKLSIQRTISILSEQDVQYETTKQAIQKSFSTAIADINEQLTINSLLVDNKDSTWNVNAVLQGDPAVVFTENDRIDIQKRLQTFTKDPVAVNIQIVPLVELLSNESVENKKIIRQVQKYLTTITDTNTHVSSNVQVLKNDDKSKQLSIVIELKIPVYFYLSDDYFTTLKKQIEQDYEKTCTLQVNTIGEQIQIY